MRRDSAVEDLIHVATPYGNGCLSCNSECPNGSDSNWYDTDMVRVEFPWGYMRIHAKEICFEPEFVFYALHKGERIKFSLCISLDSFGIEMMEAVRNKLDIAEDLKVTLVQADSVHKVEIQPHQRIVDCTIHASHPILIIVSPMILFKCIKGFELIRCHENGTCFIQTADGFVSQTANFTIDKGIRYWEVHLIHADDGDGIFLGVATELVAESTNLLSESGFWGLSCRSGHKIHGIVNAYTDAFHSGDTVGVLMDMRLGQLTFYKNNHFLGIAFRNISVKRLYPIFASTSTSHSLRLSQTTSPPLC